MSGIYKWNMPLLTDGTLRSDDNLIATEEESNSALNINSIDDSDRLDPTGSLQPGVAVTESKRIQLTKRQINTATWNVRILKQAGKLHLLINELTRMNCKITGISETRWNDSGYFQCWKDFNIYYPGPDSGKIGGVAIVVDPIVNKALSQHNPVNHRIISIRLHSKPYPITVIQVYTATTNEE